MGAAKAKPAIKEELDGRVSLVGSFLGSFVPSFLPPPTTSSGRCLPWARLARDVPDTLQGSLSACGKSESRERCRMLCLSPPPSEDIAVTLRGRSPRLPSQEPAASLKDKRRGLASLHTDC